MEMALSLAFVISLCSYSAGAGIIPVFNYPNSNGIPVQVNSGTGEEYNLNLIKAGESVLHPNIKVISVNQNDETGQLSFDTWTPTKDELHAAQDVYIDEENLAAIRFKHGESGGHEMEGVVDGRRLEKANDGMTVLSANSNTNHSDYIDIGRKITHSTMKLQATSTAAVVEVALICDKEWGDIFQHNRQRILDYFTVYFWDLNMRYKTLPSSSISFRITSIVVISTTAGQPFIEQARASDGRAEFGRILVRFKNWAYDQISGLPKFDMAIAITNTRLEWDGGLAYVRAACAVDHNSRTFWGTLVINDGGDWDSLTVGAHEMAHSLGAPHDESISGCQASGYIMSGGHSGFQWFFSTCSDTEIGRFVSSNEASCLRRLDEPGSPAINPSFSSPLAPSFEEQCRRRLNAPNAVVDEKDTANCQKMRCLIPKEEGGWRVFNLSPVDNSECKDGGRCFRGRCRQLGSLIVNVATGQCMRASSDFEFTVLVEMVNCVRPGTPLDRFLIYDEPNGKRLSTPWNSPDATEIGDRCARTANAEGGRFWTGRCSSDNGSHWWDFIDVGNDEVLLQHRITKRCAKQNGDSVNVYVNCDRNDRSMRWRLE